MKHYDYIFVGGGGSSLALLLALHNIDELANSSVLIIEPDQKDSNDRTWCFWTDHTDTAYPLVKELIDHRWTKINNVNKELSSLAPFEYIQIRSADLYAYADKVLAQYPKVERLMDRASSLKAKRDAVVVNTETAQYSCDIVFDSRPPKLKRQELLWQSFVGWRIEIEKSVFDPDTCTLMDFDVPQNGALQFMYLLPTAENKALIEFTRFGAEVLSQPVAVPIMESYLKKLGIKDYKIEEWEVDKIPMTLELNKAARLHPQGQRIIPIGLAAGNAKASTGFAFKNILKHSANIAAHLQQQKKRLPRPQQKANFQYYDQLLLRILNQKPEISKQLFVRLFEKHPLPRLLRFLDEETSLSEDLMIMYQMPWRPFFWSIKKSLLQGGSIAKKKSKQN